MGTTAVGLWLADKGRRGWIFHVGDSRCYHFNSNGLTLLTRDHTLYEAWLAAGGEGVAPKRNVIMRALGPSPHVEPDVRSAEFQSGDVVLLCSDGLSSMIEDDVIAHVLTTHMKDGLEACCAALVEQAMQAGGRDNVTIILARWL